MFQTVWHDDGETLYEATWYPVIYAAAAAWEGGDVPPERFAADFPFAFFGAGDPSLSADALRLAAVLRLLEPRNASYGQTDALFWAGAFDTAAAAQVADGDLSRARREAEAVEEDRYFNAPPLHANAAFVMFLAARRYDALARKIQIGAEVRAMYADALAHAGTDRDRTLRDLFWCRYWMWELRDTFEDVAPLYERAWRYESRDGHLASNLERYHLAAQRAIEYADAFYAVTRQYVQSGSLPPLTGIVSP